MKMRSEKVYQKEPGDRECQSVVSTYSQVLIVLGGIWRIANHGEIWHSS